MPALIEVRFKGNRKDIYTWESDAPLTVGDAVVVEVERGLDMGVVAAVGAAAEKKCGIGCTSCPVAPKEPKGKIVRPAAKEEARAGHELRKAEEDVRRKVIERVRAHNLPMKVSDVEWQWDRKKLTVYFTAEQRVDFRVLVRDLAAQFRTRLDLRQIGARDEAKRLDGVGRCGRQYCCSSWLPELKPVSLALAKDQRLSLNPSQISGGCGRLLCCLRYEHDFYVTSRKRFPKEGKTLRTARGEERVQAVDIFRERVLLRAEDGTTRSLALAELGDEIAPHEVHGEPPAPALPGPDDAAHDATIPPAAEGLAASAAPGRKRRRRRRRGRGGRRNGGSDDAPHDDPAGGAAGSSSGGPPEPPGE